MRYLVSDLNAREVFGTLVTGATTSTQVNIYLFRAEARSFDELLDRRFLSGSYAYIQIAEQGRSLSFPHRAYLQVNAPAAPSWLRDLADVFDTKEWAIENRQSSFVLLFCVANRFFAVPYGRGYQALKHDLLEAQFGLRSTLAAMDTAHVKRVSAYTVTKNSRQRTTEFKVAAPLTGFGIEAGLETVSELHSAGEKSSIFRRIGGKTSLAIGGEFHLSDLAQLGSQALDYFNDPITVGKFSWMFPHTRVCADKVANENLPVILKDAIANRSRDVLGAAAPENETNAPATSYEVRFGRKKDVFPVLDLEAIYFFLDRHEVRVTDLEKVYVEPFDAEGSSCGRRRPLLEYFFGEWQQSGSLFAYLNGDWFQLNKNHVSYCRDIIRGLKDVTREWGLPVMNSFESEAEYNARVAAQKRWLLLDRNNFSLGNTQKAEICDLLTPQGHLICVKRMTASKALSHLFAQGSVSAELFRLHPEFRDQLKTRLQKRWPKAQVPETPTIVYAIPSSKPGPLWKTMYGFSAINLVRHVNRIHQHGFDVMLCGITEAKMPMPKGRALDVRTHRKAA